MSETRQNKLSNLAGNEQNINNNLYSKSFFSDLNENQKCAVDSLDGPLLVLSGAGTGKTRVLTARLANLIHSGKAKPWNILAVTFTNKAAREMRFRLESLIGSNANSLWLGTFHSIAARILRQNAELVDLNANFTIINPDDQKRLLKELIVFEKLDEKKITPQFVSHLINSWKDKGLTYKDIINNDQNYMLEGKAGKIFKDYQERLTTLNYVDFADLILHNLTIFKENEDVLESFKKQITFFLVDEYQDTNTAQYLWLKILVKPENNICCVGDDDQSIYGWRGAEVGNILGFEKDFPNAKIVRLEQNYRSSENILNAANHLISNNKSRLGKSLKTVEGKGEQIHIISSLDGHDETRQISAKIEKINSKGIKYDQIAVLVRAGYQTRVFEERFVQVGLPYKVIGAKFYERLEIRDALSYFRVLLQNSDDLALERIINVPKRGIGSRTLNIIKNYARLEKISIFLAIEELIMTDELRPSVKKSLIDLIELFKNWEKDLKSISHTELAIKILEESFYIDHLKNEKTLESETRLENLKELINAMSNFDNMIGFLEHISLVTDGDTDNTDGEISLMTLHASKGLEFEAVFLPCWEEGSFPSQRSLDENGLEGLEEERRLAYVGITRAKKFLTISYVSNRQIHGLWQNLIPSRFINELPNNGTLKVSGNAEQINDSNNFSDFDFDQDYKYIRSNESNPNFRKKNNQKLFNNNYASTYQEKNFIDGDRVFHSKFGMGTVKYLDANKANVEFDKAGNKNVITSFLTKHS